MANTIIKVENLGKKYLISHQAPERYTALRDVLANKTKSIAKKILSPNSKNQFKQSSQENFWALKDVSFEVKQGEVIGIIGRNGAGKTTLLKVLSRITEPTTGSFRIKGRVASLLEVGTGFHPELTGRENIFLNGAILGMTRQEIKKKFDKIVAFAEIEKFLDTPVKRYSSGMYVRLAFAVAAHLEPEILFIDEVLSVGDIAFQKKCLGKMDEVAKSGRTVLFVSHNMGAIRQLCNRGVYLQEGLVNRIGEIEPIINSYVLNYSNEQKRAVTFDQIPRKPACILKVAVTCLHKSSEDLFDINDQIEVLIEYMLHEQMSGVNVALIISREGIPVFTSFDIDVETHLFTSRLAGHYRARIWLPTHLLKAGMYTATIALGRSGVGLVDLKNDALIFDIGEMSEDTTHKGYAADRSGMLALALPWNTEQL